MAKGRQTGKSGSASGKLHSKSGVPTAEYQRWVAEAAYYRAQQRSFEGGDPVADWIAAEADISKRLLPSPAQQKAELAAFEKLRKEFAKTLAGVRESVNLDTIKHAADTAGQKLKTSGKHTAEAVDNAAHALQKDIANTANKLGEKWQAFSGKTADVFDVWRDRSSVFLAHASTAVGEWLEQIGKKGEHPIYHTGEMATSGSFACTACGETIELRTSAHLPPCPHCYKTEFRRTQ